MVAISIIVIFLYGLLKAIRDKISFHFNDSIFSSLGDFWNPTNSWKFKWKNGNKDDGERFPLSSTWLVSLTDCWHLVENISSISICLLTAYYTPVIYYHWLLTFVLLKIIYATTFHIFFTYIFRKKV